MSSTTLTLEGLARCLSGHESARRWVVALSGGMDSTVLLHLLAQSRPSYPDWPPLAAIHINHQIHSRADQWQGHCRKQCDALDIPLIEERVELEVAGDGLEAAARRARYSAFERHLEEGDVLLMAHHLDDQVETLLLRLMRGTGLTGLAGMPAERPLGSALVLRPLLSQSRSTLAAYAEKEQLSWIDDPSNVDTDLDRNFLRHDVIPLLASRWPGYRETTARASAHLADAAQLLARHYPRPETLFTRCGDPGLPLAALRGAPESEVQLGLRAWLLHQGLPLPGQARSAEFLRQLASASEDARPELSGPGFQLQRYGEGVFLSSSPKIPAPFQVAPGDVVHTEIGEVSLLASDGDGFVIPEGQVVSVGFRLGGERLRVMGRPHSTSLKRALQALEVPPWWRSRVPLASIDGECVDVGGYLLCDSAYANTGEGAAGSRWRLSWRPKIRPS